MKVEKIIIHHTAGPDGSGMDLEAIEVAHKDRGWRKVGYHVVIEEVNGKPRAHLCRALDEIGAHCQGHNDSSLGVAIVGNYSVSPMDLRLLDLAARHVVGLLRAHRLKPSAVVMHGELRNTECPGRMFPVGRFGILVDRYYSGYGGQ